MINAIFKIIIDGIGLILYDNNILLAIIAINMTVIGLTSLADKKTIIGIDYGEFLIKEFRFLGMRMYWWLIIFALINAISLFTMFIYVPIIRKINLSLLVASLLFAIYYFFAFILVENRQVVKHVYIKELLGLYCDSDDKKHFYIDNLVGMNSGTRTSNKLSTNIIDYFNDYNGNTIKVFKEIFGPNSIIYSQERYILRARKKHFNIRPYMYRASPDNEYIKEISFEFFQLFRFVEHQERWALDILLILNGEPRDYKNYDIFRLYNFARLTAQIKTFGISENLFKYKFLFHYGSYWLYTINAEKPNRASNAKVINHIMEIEEEIVTSLFEFISKTINKYSDKEYVNTIEILLEDILLDNKYKGFIELNKIVMIISKISINSNCVELQRLIERCIGKYKVLNDAKNSAIDIDELRKYIQKIQEKRNDSIVVERLFDIRDS